MVNPFLSRGEKKNKQGNAYWKSAGQEKKIAKQLGGQRISGSGSKLRKGDVTVAKVVRIEAKTTQHSSFSVTREMISKITHAGLAADEVPAIVIDFIDAYGKKIDEVAVIPMRFLEILIHNAKGD